MRTAQEGVTVRSITLVLYSQWLGDDPRSTVMRRAFTRKRSAPSWFGCVKAGADVSHDMASVRRSITRHHGE